MKRKVSFGFEITKVDAEKRIVGGVATDSIKDRQGDIIPFGVAVAAFEECADTLGIREMHAAKAVGRLEGWLPDEEAQSVPIEVYLSESTDGNDALTKVKEGILRGFSLGGNALASHRENGVNIIDKLEIVEISLVDVPANPHAVISVVKAAGMEKPEGKKLSKVAGSYRDLESKLGEAVAARRAVLEPVADTECCCCDTWVEDWGVDWVIYHDGSDIMRCAWGRNSDGSIILGPPEEVEETYVPKGRTEITTTEVPSMASELVIKNREDMAVAKALTARNLVRKGDVGSAIKSVSDLLSTAGTDPDAMAQAQAALSVVSDMVTSLESDESTEDSSSTGTTTGSSTGTTGSSVELCKTGSESGSSTSTPSTSTSTGSTPSTASNSTGTSTDSGSTPSTASTSTGTSTDSGTSTGTTSTGSEPSTESTSTVTKNVQPAPAGTENAPTLNPGVVNGVTLEAAAKAGAAAALGELLNIAKGTESKDIGTKAPENVETLDPIEKALADGDYKAALEAADGDQNKVDEVAHRSVIKSLTASGIHS